MFNRISLQMKIMVLVTVVTMVLMSAIVIFYSVSLSELLPQDNSQHDVYMKRMKPAIFTAAAVGILLVVLFGLIIRKLLVMPLLAIREAACTVKQGERYCEIELDASHEIQEVATAFNDMVRSLERKYAQLQQALQTLQSTQNQLVQSEKMAALGNMMAGVAHEINTPIGIGVTASSFLAEKTADIRLRFAEQTLKRSELEQYISDMAEATAILDVNLRRASDLIRSYKKVAADQSNESKRKFLLKPYMEEIVFSLSPAWNKTKHRITVEADDALELYSEPGAISQVVTNLIMNSLIHAFPANIAGEMKLTAWREGEQIRIIYSDNGKGMSAETAEQIFEPFFTTNRGSGTGLGMNIVYNIVTNTLNGTISCQSKPNEGVTFIIDFPVEEAPA